MNIAHELLVVLGGDVGDPAAHVGGRGVGHEQRAMDDGMSVQLAFKLDCIPDGDREFRPELQPLFRQVQNIAEYGIPIVLQEGATFDREAEPAAVFSHEVGLHQSRGD